MYGVLDVIGMEKGARMSGALKQFTAINRPSGWDGVAWVPRAGTQFPSPTEQAAFADGQADWVERLGAE